MRNDAEGSCWPVPPPRWAIGLLPASNAVWLDRRPLCADPPRTAAQGRRRGGDVGEFRLADAPRIGAPTIAESDPADWTPRGADGSPSTAARPSLPHRLIRRLDAVLRRFYGIHEFSGRPDCLLRISVARSECEARLADG